MARFSVDVPDDVAERAKARGVNVSALAQAAIRAELDRPTTDDWLATLGGPTTRVRHADVVEAIDAGR